MLNSNHCLEHRRSMKCIDSRITKRFGLETRRRKHVCPRCDYSVLTYEVTEELLVAAKIEDTVRELGVPNG